LFSDKDWRKRNFQQEAAQNEHGLEPFSQLATGDMEAMPISR
jgi:hypothetical protein